MKRQTKVSATNRKIVKLRDMGAFAPHLHKARLLVALFFDPTSDVGGTPARGDHQVGPGSSEYGRLRPFETQAGCAKTSEQEIVEIYKPAEIQFLDFVGPTQRFCETERLCGVSRVTVCQYPHRGIAVKA